MYSSWQWPTAVNATDTSTVQPTTAATVAAVSASNVTPQWPTQTVAYGQYAVPATMQQPWAAAWQYAYPSNMAVGQVRPQYPQVLPGAFPPAAQSYQAPQVYSNTNTVWPSSEGYQAVPAVAGETSAETKVEQQQHISQASDQNTGTKIEDSAVPQQPKQELAPKDEAEQEKLNQLRAQAQQWKSQQEAGPTWTFTPQTGTTTITTSTTTSTTALATPTTVSSTVSTSAPAQSQWNQGSWPQGSWNQGQWNQQQQWPQTWSQQGQQQQQTWKAENDQQQNSFQSDRTQPKAEETENNVQLQTPQLTSEQKVDDMADLDKEAEEFERQFVDWEKQFEGWKQQNINHPDREAFAGYEKQWQEWRNQLLQRREDMQRARAERKKLIDQEKQSMAEDKRPVEGQSPADVSQLTPTSGQGSFNTPATVTSNVSQPAAAPNQMIPGLDHLRNDQTATPLTSQPGTMPAVTQPVSQGVPTVPNQNLYYPPQMPPGSAPQNLMFMQPPPHQFAFPSGPPPHSQAPPLHSQAPPPHSQVLPSHSQSLPPQNQVLPQHSQGPPSVSQFQVPRHPPPPPPASGNVQNDTDGGKSYLSPDGFKNQDQKRTLLSTPPQHGNQAGGGSRAPPTQGGPSGLLPLPPPDGRFGPPNREFGGHGNHDEMSEGNQEYPSPHSMNVRHDFDHQDMMKEAERYMMMGDGEKNDPMGFENQDQYMSQEMDQNKFQDGWGYGPDRGRGRGRGFDREMRPRGRGRGRGRESRWSDENEARQFEPPPDNIPFPGDSGNRNREFGDSSGHPRDFPERRSTRWGPPSKPPPDVESNMDSNVPPSDFNQKPDEQFEKGHPSDQSSFSGKPFKGEEFKNRPRGEERGGGFKEPSGRPRDERSPFQDQFMGRPRGDDRGPFGRDDFVGAPPGDEKGHFKGSEFMDRLPADDRGPFKGDEFMGRHPGADRSGFRGEEFRGRPPPGDSRKDEFMGKPPMEERGPFNKDDDFMGRPHGDRGPMKEGFPPGPPFKGRGFPPGGGPEEPFAGPPMDKKRISELHGDERFMDDQMPPPFATFENERFPQGPMDKGERFSGRFREDDRFPPRGNPDDMFPHGRHPEPFLRGGERFPGRSGPLLGRDRFPPGPISERERMSLMGPGPMMEPFDEDKFPPHMPFDRNFPRQPPFDDERFPDERFPFREDPERFMGEERFHRGRFRDGRFGPKNFPPDELMGRPGILPGPDSPFLSRDAPFNIPDAPFPIPDAPFPIPDAPFPGLDHPFPPEEFRRNFPFDEDPRDPRFRLNFPDDRFPGPYPFDREKGPFNEPPFMGPGRRPHPFERGNERFDMRFSSIDYTHQPAVSVLGEEFTQKFDAFDQPYGADLMSYRDHHTSVLPFGTSSNQEKESAIFDYAHRRGESPHSRERSFRDRETDKNRDQDRSRERERDRDRDRGERTRDRERNRDRERERNRDRDRGRERDSEKDRDRDRKDRERDRTAHREERSRDSKRDRDHDRDRDRTKDREDGESKRSRWEHQPESADRNFSKDRGSDSVSQRQNGERTTEAGPDNVDNRNSAQLGPQPDLFKTDMKTETVLIKDLLYPPGRFSRPKQLVIILRGLSGSGKTYVAKLIKDKEVENGGSAPRILSLDDYFMVEKEVTDVDPETGKRLKRREFQFEYEKDMEEAYRTSLYKSFKKTIDDRFFPFIIVDAIHDKVKQFEQYWSYAKQRGFQVYIAEMDCKDPIICHKRNVHNRSQGDITEMMNKWEQKPQHFMDVDIRALLQDVSIREVEMEDLHTEEKKDEVSSKADDADDTDDFTKKSNGDLKEGKKK